MKQLIVLAIFLASFLTNYSQADILIRNGKILDGTGNSWYYSDIAIKDGRISQIGKQLSLDASKIIKQNIAPLIKGGGGGQKTLATAGGQDASNLDKVIEVVRGLM